MNVIPIFVLRPRVTAQRFIHLGVGLAALLLLCASWESKGVHDDPRAATVESTLRVEGRT